ncbi:lipid IV(A) 3-deoxy-D-manno-octulosonic acid transferase [Litchfieldella xinjiangensis]|uniref:lipid IV(A) 3-deoxy-D-manno-octulosonic acid transferase n=1 Tax=Litchfieldella xinjiangensis TaxID=1166948 RepID=UPI0005B92B73|nr:lipid IV(A) 3-deoxy-D-manno-octulosonic acid transferase [Halomonas xinjiangensis]
MGRNGWARWLYSAVLYGLSPLVWKRVWRERALTHSRWQRLGFVPRSSAGRAVIWLHCASVGEVLAAQPLIETLLERYPGRELVVSTMTATGAERVQAIADSRQTRGQAGHLRHCFIALDFPGAARRFVRRLRPQAAIIFETELWPNVLAACHSREVPVVVSNGRLSPRAFEGYRRVRPLMRDALSHVTWLAAKSDADAERFQALGMAVEHVTVVGSLKFDFLPNDAEFERSERLRTLLGQRPAWVAGSTHPGEDEQVLAAHAVLLESQPDALLILVPRHPQRFDAVAALCREHGFTLARRSQEERPEAGTQVYLADTMGELLGFYGAAMVAFVGGSLAPIGGHNLLEPAAMGTPVITGKHLDNFLDVAATLREADVLLEVDDATALGRELIRLFDDPDERERLSRTGQAVIEANRGALKRTLDGLATYLEEK